MHWDSFATQQPRFADLGRRRLGGPGVVLIGTIRSDGSPRVSPVEPLFWGQDLWLSMLWGSRKAADLDRDPRILVHNTVPDRNGELGEYKVRGHAVAEGNLEVQQGFADEVQRQVGWSPEPGSFHLYWVNVDDVTFVRYDDSTGDQFMSRWPQGAEFVRRGTSANRYMLVGDVDARGLAVHLEGSVLRFRQGVPVAPHSRQPSPPAGLVPLV